MQLLPAEVAGEVVVGQNNQHLTAAIHTVRHVLDDRPSVGWSVGRSVSRLVGWLVGWLVS